uniref:SAM domain-containing protein n=1 Tax=Caenorhabditis tropicalis TaxID=1561998 RepID=A0A1I7UKV8_9PELO
METEDKKEEPTSSNSGQSLLAQLLQTEDPTECKSNVTVMKVPKVSRKKKPVIEGLKKIVPTVSNVVLPPGKSCNYTKWKEHHVRQFLAKITDENTANELMKHQITGQNLFYCFIHEETSEDWRRQINLGQGTFQKIRMAIGNIHNIHYKL